MVEDGMISTGQCVGWEMFSCPICHTRDEVFIEITGKIVVKFISCCDYVLVDVEC